jgi:crotonobetainyl-CoA:carnitine CoA-transferase CaiB-like acyl-CoA transferase
VIELLKGIKVIESAMLFNGPTVGALLGSMGADVIKIEPPGGDYMRHIMGAITPGHSPAHLQVNKDKRSIKLNLKKPEGLEVFWKLLDQADVFIDGYIGDACTSLGIGYEAQKARKPGIVYLQYTGYGAAGPYANIPTHGRMMSAVGGMFALRVGDDGLVYSNADAVQDGGFGGTREGGEPSSVGGVFSALYIVAALVQQLRTGKGAYIDVSAADAAIATGWSGAIYGANAHRVTEWVGMPVAQPGDNRLADPPPIRGLEGARYYPYETRDGRFIMFGAIEHRWWEQFCELVGREDLIGERDESSPIDMAIGDLDLYHELRKVFLERDAAEWVALAAEHHIPIGPVNMSVADLLADPQLRGRQIFAEGTHPEAGPFTYVGTPAVVAGQKFEVRLPAPELGEHTDEILRELGYGDEDIERLHADRVV